MNAGVRRRALAGLAAGLVLAAVAAASPASAHGFTSVVYADIGETGGGHVRVELQLEYDLLVVSAADALDDDALFQDGIAAFDGGDAAAQAAALDAHADTVVRYVAERFAVSSGGVPCTPQLAADFAMTTQEGVPYAVVVLDETCGDADESYTVTSTLFPDDEEYVTGTTTILTYELDARSGSAALDARHPTFSTAQPAGERFWEFFLLGGEHLLGGADHILFLLALIAGSRRLREVVLAATSFTVAHSVTFILAATGAVTVPATIIEPTIALSISIVAAWHLWRLWRRGRAANELDAKRGAFGIDRAGWIRLGVVFLFGLVHGLGFASALGIDEPWSWDLLWSLLVFNLGIEVVQIALIALVFPVLTVLRRRAPKAGLWVTGALAVAVTVAGLVWFVERLLGG